MSEKAGEPLPRPGKIAMATLSDGKTVITLPKAVGAVTKRTIYLEVGIYGTRTLSPCPRAATVDCELPEGVRIAAFVVDEGDDGTRSEASPVTYFWVGD